MWWTNKKQQRESLACVASLAGGLLVLTTERPMREYFRRERVEARRILRRAARPRYVESGTARADLNWLREAFGEIHEFALEANNQPVDYTPGWGTTYTYWPEGSELTGAMR